MFHESLKFDCVGFSGSDEEKYEDENLTIWPVIINGKLALSSQIGSVTVEPRGLLLMVVLFVFWDCLLSRMTFFMSKQVHL